MTNTRSHRSRRRHLGLRLVAILLASVFLAASANAAEPPGFVDGEWTGFMQWGATVEVPDVEGSADSVGEFAVGFSGGIPLGSFRYVVDNGSGVTPEAKATLQLEVSGTFEGTATEPVLVADGGSVTGTVEVFEVDDNFDVNFALGAGELAPLPLDILTADCSFVTGSFTTQTAQLGEIAGGLGGSATVREAYWSARRIGDFGATDLDQSGTLDKLFADGVDIANTIYQGSYDATALHDWLGRVEALTAGVTRNTACGIGRDGHYASSVGSIVYTMLIAMVANDDLFDVHQFLSATLAGVRSGVLGASGGPSGDALGLDLRNVFWTKFANAVAGSNAAELKAIQLAGIALGDQMMADDALEELSKL